MNSKTVRIAELQDDDAPPAADPYAPRTKASQQVAAAKRQRPTHDTEPITPLALPSQSRRQLIAAGMVLLILLMIGAASYQLARLPGATPLAITPAPTIAATDAPSAALSAPTSAPTKAPTPRTISAYAAPDGALLGPIEADRMIVPIAHYGSAWIQADVAGSGLVWLRAVDVPALALVGPDLAPAAAQPQTGQPLTIDQVGGGAPPDATSAPAAAPEAVPTATPVVWPTSAPASPADFEKPDIKQRCQFVGCLGQNAVDLARAQACHALYWQHGDSDPETIPEPDYSAVRGCIWEGLYR